MTDDCQRCGSLRREDGELLTSIDPGFIVERRAHRSSDGYLLVVTWQSDPSGKEFRAIDCWELSPALQVRLGQVFTSRAQLAGTQVSHPSRRADP